MSDLVTIIGKKRQDKGKNHARKLRAKGLLPANLLDKATSTLIEFDPKWLSKAWKTGKRFNLEFEGKTREVEIKELQIHPVKRTALHVDLMFV